MHMTKLILFGTVKKIKVSDRNESRFPTCAQVYLSEMANISAERRKKFRPPLAGVQTPLGIFNRMPLGINVRGVHYGNS
jgi:hypothetical protein